MGERRGGLVELYDYDDFGLPIVIDPATGAVLASDPVSPFLLTGHFWDAEAGLYWMRFRWYDPWLGRFLTRDPLGVWGDLLNLGNGTAYVGNNPWSYTDPWGLRGWAAQCGVSIRNWANSTFSENVVGSIGFGTMHAVTAPLFLGEGTAEAIVGYEAFDGNDERISGGGRVLRVVGDVGDALAIAGGVGVTVRTAAKTADSLGNVARSSRAVDGTTDALPALRSVSPDELFDTARRLEGNWPEFEQSLALSGHIVGMASRRSRALGRWDSLAPRIEEHLGKIASSPTSTAVGGWKKEIRAWIDQLEAVMDDLGKATRKNYEPRLAEFKSRLEACP